MRREVAEWLAGYRPQMVPANEWADTGLRAFVIEQIKQLDPPGIARGKKCALQLAKLGLWCIEQGIELDVEKVLDPDTVERYCTYALAGNGRAGDYRSMLRSLGMQLTTKAPWQPSPAPLKQRTVAPPYDQRTIDRFRRDAAAQSTELRRRTFTAVLALGLGAGLDGRWIHLIHGGDVDTIGHVTVIEVPEPAPRIVPVLAEWSDTVLELAETAGDELLMGGKSNRNLIHRRLSILDLGKDTPRPNCASLRSTWLASHLERGTRLVELAAAAGVQGITTFSDLLSYIPPLAADEAHQMLRGA